MDDATFARIAALFGITTSELAAPPEDAPKARQVHRLLSAAKSLDEGALAALAEMAERLQKAG